MRNVLGNTGWCDVTGHDAGLRSRIGRLLSGLVVGCALVIAGCSAGSLEPAGAPDNRTDVSEGDTVGRRVDFFPLSVGNWWSLSTGTKRLTIRVVDSLGRDEEQRFVVVYEWGAAAHDRDSLVLSSDSAGRLFSHSSDGGGPRILYLDPGAPVGSTMFGRLVDNQATATTPAGTFEKCVAVLRNEMADELDTYAPDVGPVGRTLGRSTFRLDSAFVGGRRY